MSPIRITPGLVMFAGLAGPALAAEHGRGKLTIALMYADASVVVKLILTGLILAGAASLGILALGMILPPAARASAARFLESVMVAAPVAGLLGAAWGAMTMFMGIANSPVTNLAVAAPGIAEAIISLALGLATMLLAVIAYGVIRPRRAG